MPADTFGSMIFGLVVILGILLIYTLSLIVRTHRVKMVVMKSSEAKKE